MIDEMVGSTEKWHIIDMCLKWHDIIAGILCRLWHFVDLNED